MNIFKKIIIFSLLLCLPLVAFATDKFVHQSDFSAYTELEQTKLDAAKSNLQKDYKIVETRLDNQDKRISDVNFTLTMFGAFLTVLVLVAGGVGWVSVKARTREEARAATKEWFEENARGMEQEISDLRQQAKEAHDSIEKLKLETKRHFQSAQDEVQEDARVAKDKIQKNMGNSSSKTASDELPSTQNLNSEALEKMEQAIRNKPEVEYGFEDWDTRAFNAWHKKDFEGAARYWRFAAQITEASNVQISQSLNNAGVALGQQNRSEEAIAMYDEIIKRYGDAPEAALRELVANALYNKGFSLGTLNRSEEAIAMYDKVIKRYGDAPEAAPREQVAKALYNKGNSLYALNQNEDAIVVYDEIIKRYGDAPEAALRELIAKALINKGFSLGTLNRSEDAIAMCDEIIKRYGDAPEAALREQVAKALYNKGHTLAALNQNEDAIVVYDEIIKRYGHAPEAALRELVAKALYNKGHTLNALNQNEDAIVVYDEIMERYGDAPEAALREPVLQALNSKGFSLLCRAKQHWQNSAKCQADLEAAAVLFKQAVGDSKNHLVLGNQAYAAFLLGEGEVAQSLLRQALQQGGEKLYKATLGDLDIFPVPPDKEFRAMLEMLWTEIKSQG